MRAVSAKFDFPMLKKAVDYAHEHGVRVYLTCNTVPTNEEADQLPEFLKKCPGCWCGRFIIADMGVLRRQESMHQKLKFICLTQTGIVNYRTANELYRMGAKRVVLARELSIDDIRTIREKTPSDLEIEVFVHGAMCMSFSGRCLLSHYLVGQGR